MMNASHTPQGWTLKDLVAKVAVALSSSDVDQTSGRVRDIPNARTLRYYTTLGLLDKPLAFRGRTALYGRRHLLQVVAIKRLQARGLSLDDVQSRLLGQTDHTLAAIANLPAEVADLAPASPDSERPQRRQGAFWETLPAPPARPSARLPGVHQAIVLTRDVTLLLGADARALDPEDLEAIHAAAAPLLQVLRTRRLRSDEPMED